MEKAPTNERHDLIVYGALALAGACLVATFILAAFLAGYLAAGGSLSKNYLPINPDALKKKMYAANAKIAMSKQSGGYTIGNITIVQGKMGTAAFTQSTIKVPAGNTITWGNKTDQTQVLIANDGGKTITLASGQTTTMSFPQGGRSYSWHLESNPDASVTVYVGG